MKKTPRQIAALIGVVILVSLYIITFVVALLDFPGSERLFQACLVTTVALPILIWIYIWLYGKTKEKDTIATIFPDNTKEEINGTTPAQDNTNENGTDT